MKSILLMASLIALLSSSAYAFSGRYDLNVLIGDKTYQDVFVISRIQKPKRNGPFIYSEIKGSFTVPDRFHVPVSGYICYNCQGTTDAEGTIVKASFTAVEGEHKFKVDLDGLLYKNGQISGSLKQKNSVFGVFIGKRSKQ